jgi:hypothetical protein
MSDRDTATDPTLRETIEKVVETLSFPDTGGGTLSTAATSPLVVSSPERTAVKIPTGSESAPGEKPKNPTSEPRRPRATRFDRRRPPKVITREVLDLRLEMLAGAPRERQGLGPFAWASLSSLGTATTGVVHGVCTMFGTPTPTGVGLIFPLAEIIIFAGWGVATAISIALAQHKDPSKTAGEVLAEIRVESDPLEADRE